MTILRMEVKLKLQNEPERSLFMTPAEYNLIEVGSRLKLDGRNIHISSKRLELDTFGGKTAQSTGYIQASLY